jgi:hypothetical protein
MSDCPSSLATALVGSLPAALRKSKSPFTSLQRHCKDSPVADQKTYEGPVYSTGQDGDRKLRGKFQCVSLLDSSPLTDRFRGRYGLVIHGPRFPVYPGDAVKEHRYAKKDAKSGLVHFRPQPTMLFSITAADEEHFCSSRALFVEGVAFQDIDNARLVAQITEAWKETQSTYYRHIMSPSLKIARQDALKALATQHSELVRGRLETWLADLVPGMHLTDLYQLVRLAACLAFQVDGRCSTNRKIASSGCTA